jgi:hypothetical protein
MPAKIDQLKRPISNTLFLKAHENISRYLIYIPKIKSTVVSRAYWEKTLVLKWQRATELIKISTILNKNEFIQVSLILHYNYSYFMGWNLNIQGIENFIFPLVTHQSKYNV